MAIREHTGGGWRFVNTVAGFEPWLPCRTQTSASPGYRGPTALRRVRSATDDRGHGSGVQASLREVSRVHYVGVDLAWGEKGTTGLAAVDEDGVLLDVTERGSDEEIHGWLQPWVADNCLVAIDAPMIVNNLTGNRPCESLIGTHFGRYNASCHSANMSNPNFAHGTRARRIADALGLDIDPASSAPRRAVEVYPHPAIVALFELPSILRYKAKPGRDLDLLRSELLRLIGLLEDLSLADVPLYVGQSAAWQHITDAVRGASGKAGLRRVEDSIDAVVCAYIARYAILKRESVRVMGDLTSGYILTPVTPEIGLALDSVSGIHKAQ